MELMHLRCFVAASRSASIVGAAAALHLTPSPVSRTLRQLESELGMRLFDRKYHRLELTGDGRRLLPQAVEIVVLAGDLLVPPGDARSLRMGATPWAPYRFAARMRAAAGELGEPVGRLDQEMSSELLHALAHGDLDLALVHLPVDAPGIAVRALARYQFHVFSATDRGLPPVTHLSALRGARALVFPAVLQPKPMLELLARIRQAGLEIQEIEFADIVMIESLLRRHDAIMIGYGAEDTPLWPLIGHTALYRTRLELEDINFELGLAWRERDGIGCARVRALVARIAPEGMPIAVV